VTKGEGGNGGKAYRLYQAAFDRVPDLEGLGYWIDQVDKGEPLWNLAHGFITSEEFKLKYGENPTNEEYIQALYQNVCTGRRKAPDTITGCRCWTPVRRRASRCWWTSARARRTRRT
jgi:hypothetical protein